MRRRVAVTALLFCALAIGSPAPAHAAQSSREGEALQAAAAALRQPRAENYSQHVAHSQSLTVAFASLTDQAVNPLFGLTVRGMWVYLRTPAATRTALPWFHQPEVWGPLAIVLLLMLFNSTIVEAAPPLKIPLNALGDLVNKGTAILALPIFVSLFAESAAIPASEALAALWDACRLNPTAYAATATTAQSASTGLAASLGYAAGLVVGTFVYGTVWLAFNTVDVLILICPFPAVDACLKSARLAVVGILAGLTHLSPGTGLAAALLILAASLLIAGWSMRLSIFGLLYSTDLLARRHAAPMREATALWAFSSTGLQPEVPIRTLGALARNEAGQLVFQYRPWLLLPRRHIVLPDSAQAYAIGEGLLNPYLTQPRSSGSPSLVLRFLPRHRGHEEELDNRLGTAGVQDTRLLRGFRSLWRLLSGGESAPART